MWHKFSLSFNIICLLAESLGGIRVSKLPRPAYWFIDINIDIDIDMEVDYVE
jgi:hypothetical protein